MSKLVSTRSLIITCAVAAALSGSVSQIHGQTIPKLPVETYTLPNGLRVILHQDRSTPLVAVNTWYHVGSGDEAKGRTGFAHLFEHIMFMGSQNVATGQFDQLLEAAGASNNGSTTEDRTNYFETLPSNALPLALWLDADRMGFLLQALDAPKLDLQRDVVKNERRERVDNQPYGRAQETIAAALYPATHPYSWPVIGSMADLSAASMEDVQTFFRTYYAPNNATIAIVGDFNSDTAKALISKYFGDIPRGPSIPARPKPTAVVLAADKHLSLEDDVQLPRLYYTWPTVRAFDRDDAALGVLGSALAEGKNSRLYKTLVYDRQVAQDVAAYQYGLRLNGIFQIIITPKPGVKPATIDSLVRAELQRLRTGGITPRELARVQNSTRSAFLDRLSSVEQKADLLNSYFYSVGTADYVRQDLARFDAVTRADVQRVANGFLGKPKVVLTVVPKGETEMMVRGGAR
jgi:zinc protease